MAGLRQPVVPRKIIPISPAAMQDKRFSVTDKSGADER